MTKLQLLQCLADAGQADAFEVAEVCDVSYSTAAMALLRVVRQGLVARFFDPDRGIFWYSLTPSGHERIAYLSARADA
jgi:DNA-binding MarR family transcriptional regulator